MVTRIDNYECTDTLGEESGRAVCKLATNVDNRLQVVLKIYDLSDPLTAVQRRAAF
jgi:hypothetical protein